MAVLVLCIGAMSEKASYKKMTESFMTGILQNEVDKSCDELFLNSPLSKYPEKVKYLKEQIKPVINVYGKPFDYEFIKKQKYGDSIVRLVYIAKTNRLPLTWEFYFYKATSDWKIIHITFNDQYDLLADK